MSRVFDEEELFRLPLQGSCFFKLGANGEIENASVAMTAWLQRSPFGLPALDWLASSVDDFLGWWQDKDAKVPICCLQLRRSDQRPRPVRAERVLLGRNRLVLLVDDQEHNETLALSHRINQRFLYSAQTSAFGIMLLDGQAHCLFANDATSVFLQRSFAELAGHGWLRALSMESGFAVRQYLKNDLCEKSEVQFELALRDAGDVPGLRLRILTEGLPGRLPDGALAIFSDACNADVKPAMNADEVFESLPVPALILRKDSYILATNRKARELLMLEDDSYLSARLPEFDRNRLFDAFQRTLSGHGAGELELLFTRADQQEILSRWMFSVRPDGHHGDQMIATGFDMSSQRLRLMNSDRQASILSAVNRLQSQLMVHSDIARDIEKSLTIILDIAECENAFLWEVVAPIETERPLRSLASGSLVLPKSILDMFSRSFAEQDIHQHAELSAMLQERRPLLISGDEDWPAKLDWPYVAGRLMNALIVPLTVSSSVLGVLMLTNRIRPFEREFVELLQPVLQFMSTGIATLRLYRARRIQSQPVSGQAGSRKSQPRQE